MTAPAGERTGARRWLAPLARNLRSGARLAFGLRVRVWDLRASLAQVFALTVLNLAPAFAVEFLQAEAPRQFSAWGLMRYASLHLLFFALVAGLAIGLRTPARALLLCVALLAAGAWSALAVLLVDRAEGTLFVIDTAAAWYAYLGAFAAWTLFYTARALRLCFAASRARVAVAAVGYVAVSVAASLLLPHVPLWYTEYPREAAAAEAGAPLDVERIYYRQGALLDAALAALAPGSPSAPDVYFVGFAPYAGQDVFRKEVEFVRRTVAARLGAGPRSLVLVNHRDTVDTVALANPSNLARALDGIARRMDRDDDVLFLYLTSHGSPDASLAVDFVPLAPNALDATRLRALLDASGIRHRIVVVSACYSGTFIDALRDPDTLVLTAAHAQKTSFGCSNDRELTYFAEHLFARAWSQGRGLLEAFARARETLETREREEGYEYSDPQRFVGERIAGKLREIE